MYSIKISKGKGLKAFFQATEATLQKKLNSFKEKGFVIERVVDLSKEKKCF
jgi:hypothetical protein